MIVGASATDHPDLYTGRTGDGRIFRRFFTYLPLWVEMRKG